MVASLAPAYLGRIIGKAEEGHPLILPDSYPVRACWPFMDVHHGLVVGGTGAGKSTLLRVVAQQLITTIPVEQRVVVLVDGKGADSFLMFEGQDGVIVANGPDGFHRAVVEAHRKMMERYGLLSGARRQAKRTRGRVEYTEPPLLFLLVDEWMSGLYRMAPEKKGETVGKATDMGMLGRDAGLRIMLAMQRPDAKGIETGLPGGLKAELKLRIAVVGKLGMDKLEAQMAFDDQSYSDRFKKLSRQVQDPVGLGIAKVGGYDIPFRVPWYADATDPRTSDPDREASWRLLPAVDLAAEVVEAA